MWHYFMKLKLEEKLVVAILAIVLGYLFLRLFELLGFAVIVSVVFISGVIVLGFWLKAKLTKKVNERYRRSK